MDKKKKFIDEANYLAVTNEEGKVLAHIDLNTGEVIQLKNILVSVNYAGEPMFKEIDDEIYLKSVIESL